MGILGGGSGDGVQGASLCSLLLRPADRSLISVFLVLAFFPPLPFPPSYINRSFSSHRHLQRFSESAQLSRMRAATTQQERLSDSLVSSFLSGEGDEESFVKGYREVRKVYYRREVGLKKWEGGGVVWME